MSGAFEPGQPDASTAEAGGHGSIRPVVLVLGPDRAAISGVSTHLNLLFGAGLGQQFDLRHFQVGSEGRHEGRASRLGRMLLSPWLLAFRLVREGVAVMHVNTSLNPKAFWRDLVYMAIGRLLGVRVIYQIHGGSLLDFPARGTHRRLAVKLALRLASTVAVLSTRELRACRLIAPGQAVRLVPNGVDLQLYAGPARATSNAAEIVLLYIGRLSRDKGLFEALHALRLARLQGAAARLVIAGGGPDEAALQRLVALLHLESAVAFVGPAFGEAKRALLSRADVLLLPSYSEGLPYALLECMAAGMPAIITPVGGVPDVVLDNVHGLFVPPRDPQAIARAILRLAEHRPEIARMGAASRERVANGYSVQSVARAFAELYADPGGLPAREIIQAD